MQTIWVRFATSEGTVIGEVKVPRKCPTWFKKHLDAMTANRELTMEDVHVNDWLEACCSENRPILLARPLAPQRQEELVFFSAGKLNEMRAELERAKGSGVDPQMLLNDNQWLGRYCVFMDNLESVSLEERALLKPIPRKTVQPNNPNVREFTVYAPLVQHDGQPQEEMESFRINPSRINHYVTIKSTHEFAAQVQAAYDDQNVIVQPGSGAPIAPTFQPQG